MKPTPLLDFWQKPAGAENEEPVALLATTFAFDPDFFEQNCLARFLEVSSVDEGDGSVADIVASVELQELLQKACVTVLADRSAPVQRTSLLWDVLGCHVPTGLLHAKVAVLLWENATRVIIGSANLTAAGYRRQIELGLAADLGDGCLFTSELLESIADELKSYLQLVPGHDKQIPAFQRAHNTLSLFRERIKQQRAKEQPAQRQRVLTSFAPTNERMGALDSFKDVWSGAQPLRAVHLSPFWDSKDRAALEHTKKLLTGRPASERSQQVAVVLGPRGEVAFPPSLKADVDYVGLLEREDKELRVLHAKCLLVESDEWVAALVGSSNHTVAGLGLRSGAARHREINVWLGAKRGSKEGRALLDLIKLGKPAPQDAEAIDPKDEDEESLPALPSCFGLCRLARGAGDSAWELQLGITAGASMPADWVIRIDGSASSLLARAEWDELGRPAYTRRPLPLSIQPMYVMVSWEGKEAPWAVLADDRHGLPPHGRLTSLRAQQLLDALATGRTLPQVLREELEYRAAETDGKNGIDLNPLTRLDVKDSLLRRGRALSASLSAMQRRLERPVITADALRARLASPLGPEFVAGKIAEALESDQKTPADAMFTIAEIALTVGRIDWNHVVLKFDRAEGLGIVRESLSRLNDLRIRLGGEPEDLASYAKRAILEVQKCLVI